MKSVFSTLVAETGRKCGFHKAQHESKRDLFCSLAISRVVSWFLGVIRGGARSHSLSAVSLSSGTRRSQILRIFFFSWGQSIKVWQKIPSFDCGNLVNFEIRQDLSLHCMFRELLSASEEYPKIHRSSGRRAGRAGLGMGNCCQMLLISKSL